MTLEERIKLAETELEKLKEQQRKEKEEARKKLDAEKDKDLAAINNAIKTFNQKYGNSMKILYSSFPYGFIFPDCEDIYDFRF